MARSPKHMERFSPLMTFIIFSNLRAACNRAKGAHEGTPKANRQGGGEGGWKHVRGAKPCRPHFGGVSLLSQLHLASASPEGKGHLLRGGPHPCGT
jgi:hypothetical protein